MTIEIVQAPTTIKAPGFRFSRPPPKIFDRDNPPMADRHLAAELWRALDSTSQHWYAIVGMQWSDFRLVPLTADDLRRLNLPDDVLASYGHCRCGSTNVFIEPCVDILFTRWPHTGDGQWRHPRPVFFDVPTAADREIALLLFSQLDQVSQCWYARATPQGFSDIPLPSEQLAAIHAQLLAMPDEQNDPTFRLYPGKAHQ